MAKRQTKKKPSKSLWNQDISVAAERSFKWLDRHELKEVRLQRISTKLHVILITLALLSEGFAIWLGDMALNSTALCDSHVGTPTLGPSALFAGCGVVLAIIGLRVSIKKRTAIAIVATAIVTLICVILALVSLFMGSCFA